MRAGGIEVPGFLLYVSCRRVHLPSGQRHLKSLDRGDRISDAFARASVVLLSYSDSGVGLPGGTLPSALRASERHIEKPLSLQLRASRIACREPHLRQT